MRIAMMTNNYKPFVGGVPISIERLVEGLKSLGHEVTVFAPTYQEQEKEADVVRYPSLWKGLAGGAVIPTPYGRRIEKAFREGNFDVIHVHHPMLIGRTAVYFSKKYRVPLTFTYHTRYEQYLHYVLPKGLLKYLHRGQEGEVAVAEKLVAKYLHSFLKHCDHIFVPTKGMQDYVTDSCLYKGSVSVLPTGLTGEQYLVSGKRAKEIRKQYGAEGMPMFCTVSRMSHEKNIMWLMEAVKQFSLKYTRDFRMLFIGEGPDRAEYEAYSKELGLERRVLFTGNIPNSELADYYGACDVFLFASKSETQGIVLLEAFAAELPVIGMDATGVRDLVKDEENGFLIPEDAMDIFTEKMELLITDDLLRKRLGKGAKSTAHCFSEGEVAREALHQYNKVVTQGRPQKTDSEREAETWKISIVS